MEETGSKGQGTPGSGPFQVPSTVRSLDELMFAGVQQGRCPYPEGSIDTAQAFVNESGSSLGTMESKEKRIWFGYIRRAKKRLATKKFAVELLRTFVAVIAFLIVAGLMTLAQMASDRWYDLFSKQISISTAMLTDNNLVSSLAALNVTLPVGGKLFATDPLYDHIFTLLPDLSALRGWLPDLFLQILLFTTIFATMIFPARKRIEFQGIIVLRRFLWILTFLYFFRMCSFLVTTVPNPVHDCVPKYPQDPTAYLFLIGKMATGKISACTDNIYSGHTTLATLLFFTSITYSGRWWFSIWAFLFFSSVLITILLTRLHYTVDVLIALFMTAFVFCTYHFLLVLYLDSQLLRRRGITPEYLNAVGDDPKILEERKLILRFAATTTMRVLAWMDGLDLRLTSLHDRAPDTPTNHNRNNFTFIATEREISTA